MRTLGRDMETNGFRLAAEHKILDYQYFLVFKVKRVVTVGKGAWHPLIAP